MNCVFLSQDFFQKIGASKARTHTSIFYEIIPLALLFVRIFLIVIVIVLNHKGHNFH